MDGLRLALLRQRRDEFVAAASARSFGLLDGLLAVMLICGIGIAANGGLGSYPRILRLGLGLLLVCEAIFMWWARRRAALAQARRLEQRIEAELRQPDSAVTAAAATAAQALLLKTPR
jgi:hypothetical protein